MTREDLLKGNAQIAAQFGRDLKSYCPDVRHVVAVSYTHLDVYKRQVLGRKGGHVVEDVASQGVVLGAVHEVLHVVQPAEHGREREDKKAN